MPAGMGDAGLSVSLGKEYAKAAAGIARRKIEYGWIGMKKQCQPGI